MGDFRYLLRKCGFLRAFWWSTRRGLLQLQKRMGFNRAFALEFELGCLLFSMFTFGVGIWVGGMR